MKKILYLFPVAAFSLLAAGSAVAGTANVAWNLSGAVMPAPPYGSLDMAGSDTASKLLVNKPKGSVKANLTGVMNDLAPNAVYTVYLSKPYAPFVFTGWSLVGNWTVRFTLNGGGSYDHDLSVTSQSGGVFSGTAGYPAGGPYSINEGVAGTVSGNNFTLHLTQPPGSYYADVTGTISPGGTLDGTWTDSNGASGTFGTLSGNAAKLGTGDTYWPGLFTNSVPPFTFATDSTGSGSWHLNLRAGDLAGSSFSVWVNAPGGTVLISDDVSL